MSHVITHGNMEYPIGNPMGVCISYACLMCIWICLGVGGKRQATLRRQWVLPPSPQTPRAFVNILSVSVKGASCKCDTRLHGGNQTLPGREESLCSGQLFAASAGSECNVREECKMKGRHTACMCVLKKSGLMYWLAWLPYTQSGPIGQEQSANRNGVALTNLAFFEFSWYHE